MQTTLDTLEMIKTITGILFLLAFVVGVYFVVKQNIQTKKLVEEFKKKYSKFLEENDGQKFFCYNDKKNSNIYIEKNILPLLDESINIIYLDKNQKLNAKNSHFIGSMLSSDFPQLLKIQNGKVKKHSINNLCFNVINGTKSQDDLVQEIEKFFKDEY